MSRPEDKAPTRFDGLTVTLFVAVRRSHDPPYRYRCTHLAEQLEVLGATAEIVETRATGAADAAAKSDLVVLCRLPWSAEVEAVVTAAKRAAVPILFDIDDAILEESIVDEMPFLRTLPASEVDSYRTQIAALGKTLGASDACLAATQGIAEAAQRMGVRAIVHRNALSLADEARAEVILERSPPRTRPLLGYFSGSNTHDGDLESIAQPLAGVLGRRDDCHVLLVGFVTLPEALQPFATRVLRAPFLDAALYPWLIARCSAVLAPYERITRFIDGKSAVKVIEAGAVAVPAIASPSSEYVAAIAHGETGFIARDALAWEQHALKVLDGATRDRMGAAARQKVLAEHGAGAATDSLVRALSSVGRGGGERGAPGSKRRGGFFARFFATRAPATATERQRNGAAMRAAAMATLYGEDLTYRLAPVERPPLDIVVAVYNAPDDTKRCLESVRRHAPPGCRIVIVDDASTDEGLAAWLDTFTAGDPRVVLLRQQQNRGFVATANIGMRAGRGDVLLLNSDTEVYEGFAEGLAACAAAEPETGILSPFSNNATICSIPRFCHENELPRGLDGAAFAALVRRVSLRSYPELPTAVGFCMYIKREVLDRVGFFQEELYGRGYGEENDLCMRARAVGFRVRLCDDVFVFHRGHASFKDDTRALSEAHERILRREHPTYGYEVTRFIETNPLAENHTRVMLGLAADTRNDPPAVMFVLHASPFAKDRGGTEHYVRDLLPALAYPRMLIVYPEGAALVAHDLVDGDAENALRIRIPLGKPPAWICAGDDDMQRAFSILLAAYRVELCHVQHHASIPLELATWLADRGIPLVLSAHDYYLACPNSNLFDLRARAMCACDGSPECLAALGRERNDPSITRSGYERHRALLAPTFAHATAIVVPSERARQVLAGRLPASAATKLRVIEHGYTPPAEGDEPRVSSGTPGPLRVALLGAISHLAKGATDYLALVEATRSLPIEWHVYGPLPHEDYRQALLRTGRGRIELHGEYAREEIVGRLRRDGIALSVIMPACEETYSYTVTESLLAGVPVIASPFGAGATRVRDSGAGAVVRDVAEATTLLSELVAAPARIAELAARARTFRVRSVQSAAEALRSIHEEARALLHVDSPAPTADERMWLLQPFVGSTRPLGYWKKGAAEPRRLRLGPRELQASYRHEVSIRSGPASVTLVSKGRDPQLHVPIDPIPTGALGAIRFSAECRTPVHFQVFWTHDLDEHFSEPKSAVLVIPPSVFEVVHELRFDTPERAVFWRESAWVRRLRIDPGDNKGRLVLGPIEFCA